LSRQKLIKQLQEKNPKFNKSELSNVLDIVSDSISNALINGNSIEIRGFGRWYCKKLKENFNARNPATNELIYKPERVRIRFRASKKLNKIINE
jgi:nucleoid DNA-binding protein